VVAADDLLDEQIAYYRARAPEYDDWWFKRGRFQRPPEVRRRWAAEVARLNAAVDDFDPTGAVLDGRTFDIVKVYWAPDELRDRLAPLGWRADLRTTGEFFLHGEVVRG
jgi:hypothetical protein